MQYFQFIQKTNKDMYFHILRDGTDRKPSDTNLDYTEKLEEKQLPLCIDLNIENSFKDYCKKKIEY